MAIAALGEKKSLGNGYVFGAPVKDFGLFGCLLISAATGMMGFLAATFLSILSVGIYNAKGHHVDLSLTYKRVGLPVGVVVLLVVAGYLLSFWAKRVFRKA